MGAAPALLRPSALTVIDGGRAAPASPADAGAAARSGYDEAAARYDAAADRYAAKARAPATTRAYAADWRRWEAHCERIGAAPEGAAGHLRGYLAMRADEGAAVATIARAASGIRAGYKERGWPAPEGAIEAAVQGIKNDRAGERPDQARPLLACDMRAIFRAFPERRGLADRRDAALLALGWQAALRRSEIVALDWRDFAEFPAAAIWLRRTKGERTGAAVSIPVIGADEAAACPIRTLRALARAYARVDGDWRARPIFRRLTPRGGLAPKRLSAQSVTLIVRRRARAAGLDVDGVSAHSLRAGMLTAAALSGASTHRLKVHSRHKQTATLDTYIRDIERAKDHPAIGLL